jgi:hypothetical protein
MDLKEIRALAAQTEGLLLVNSTPHLVRLGRREASGEVTVVQTLPAAKPDVRAMFSTHPEETDEGVLTDGETRLVGTTFRPCSDGVGFLAECRRVGVDIHVIASAITLEAFRGHVGPHQILGVCPVKGLERVPSAEKVMDIDKFRV